MRVDQRMDQGFTSLCSGLLQMNDGSDKGTSTSTTWTFLLRHIFVAHIIIRSCKSGHMARVLIPIM